MGSPTARVPNTRRQEALVKYIAQKLVDQPDAVQVSRRVRAPYRHCRVKGCPRGHWTSNRQKRAGCGSNAQVDVHLFST
jgi:hypothetical protein